VTGAPGDPNPLLPAADPGAIQWSFGAVEDDAPCAWDGRLLGSRFRVDGLLGTGGMGAVYRATDLERGATVALKVQREARLTESAARRFHREGALLASLRHPGILPVYGGGHLEDGGPFLVTALIEGARDLRGYAASRPRAERLRCFTAVAEALAFAHERGIVHRDVKPANVLVDAEGRAFLCDFGLAWAPGVDDLTKTRAVLGTPMYAAPEQLRGGGDRLPSADVYSLGVILYELLADRHPHAGCSTLIELAAAQHRLPPLPSAAAPDVPPALDQVCLRALEPDPRKRYPDAGALLTDLRAAAATHGARRGPGPAVFLAAGVLLGIGAPALAALALWATPPTGAGQTGGAAEGRGEPGATPTPTPPASPPGDGAAAARTEGLRYLHGDGVPQDLDRAAAWLERAAEAGDEAAACALAELLLRRHWGYDRAADRERARRLLRRTADAGSVRALRGLGHLYTGELGGEAEPLRARECYLEAAEGGDAAAMYYASLTLGEDLERQAALLARLRRLADAEDGDGEARFYYAEALKSRRSGLEPDPALRARLLDEAAARGHALALEQLADAARKRGDWAEAIPLARRAAAVGGRRAWVILGVAHVRGDVVPRDLPRAAELFRRAARLGDREAMWRYGETLLLGQGVPRDRPAGWRWLEAAAERGQPAATYRVAVARLEGEELPADPERALAVLRRLAARGAPGGVFGLGLAHLGGHGVPRDPARGRRLLAEAAEEGLPEAHLQLAADHLRREPPDPAQAREHARSAAEGKLPAGMRLYALLLERGEGGPRDLDAARTWYARAAAQGDPDAAEALRRLGGD